PQQKRQSDHPDRLIDHQRQRQRPGNPGQGFAGNPGRKAENRNRDRHLVSQTLFRGRPQQRGRLYNQRRRRPQRAAADDHQIAQQHIGIDVGLGNADRQRDANEAQGKTAPLRRAQPFAEKQIRAERDEERGGIEKHHRTRRRRQQQAAIDQHEFDAEYHARAQSGAQRAIALEHFHAAQPRNQKQHDQRAGGADHGLQHRRNVRQRQLDRDLIKTPAQAQHQHQRDRARAERAPGRSDRQLF